MMSFTSYERLTPVSCQEADRATNSVFLDFMQTSIVFSSYFDLSGSRLQMWLSPPKYKWEKWKLLSNLNYKATVKKFLLD